MWAVSQTVAATSRGKSSTDSSGGAPVDTTHLDALQAGWNGEALFGIPTPHSINSVAGSVG